MSAPTKAAIVEARREVRRANQQVAIWLNKHGQRRWATWQGATTRTDRVPSPEERLECLEQAGRWAHRAMVAAMGLHDAIAAFHGHEEKERAHELSRAGVVT